MTLETQQLAVGATSLSEQFEGEIERLQKLYGVRLGEVAASDYGDVPGIPSYTASYLLDVCRDTRRTAVPENAGLRLTFGPAFASLPPLGRLSIAAAGGISEAIYGYPIDRRDMQAIIGDVPTTIFVGGMVVPQVERALFFGSGMSVQPYFLKADLEQFADLWKRRGFARARAIGRPVLRSTQRTIVEDAKGMAGFEDMVAQPVLAELQPQGVLDRLTAGFTNNDQDKMDLQRALLRYMAPNLAKKDIQILKEPLKSLIKYLQYGYEVFRARVRPEDAELPAIEVMTQVLGSEVQNVRPRIYSSVLQEAADVGLPQDRLLALDDAVTKEFGKFMDWYKEWPRPNRLIAYDLIEEWQDYAACRGRADLFDYHLGVDGLDMSQGDYLNDPRRLRMAVKVCNTICPVAELCRDYGIRHELNAPVIFGGIGKRQRRQEARRIGALAPRKRGGAGEAGDDDDD